jgi:predicted metalloenzyme YecM
MEQFLEEIKSYLGALSKFATLHQLPDEWFKTADHIAIKAKDEDDFVRLVQTFKPHSLQMSGVYMDNRRLATAQLNGGLNVGRFGQIGWIEIMEPRPEKLGKDVVGVEHMEFLFPEFDSAKLVLDSKKIPYQMEKNPGHEWINIKINSGGQELKLNNRLLAEAVKDEISSGTAYIL